MCIFHQIWCGWTCINLCRAKIHLFKRRNVMINRVLLILAGMFIIVIAPALAEEGSCQVEKMVFAKSVEARQPVGEAESFSADIVQVYCWTRVKCTQVPCTIQHVWYKNDKKVLEVPLKVKSSTSRTWSVKNISAGQWRVDVVDDSGNVILSGSFIVQ